MSAPRIGSLFSGYGGLDLAVENFFGATTAWHCEFDAAPSKILAHHWPDVPNLGDITKVDWSQVEPVDIITGGSPCQDLSAAGRRGGMTEGTRSNLWVQMRESIAALRPSIVIWENVRGAYSACADSEIDSELGRCPRCVGSKSGADHAPNLRALGRVLGDLSDLGFDAEVVGLRASDAGAPHPRFRVFVIAYDATREFRWREGGGSDDSVDDSADLLNLFRTPTAAEALGGPRNPDRAGATMRLSDQVREAIFPTPAVADATGGHASRSGQRSDEPLLPGLVRLFPTPRATDGEKGGPNQRGSKGDLTMNSAVQLLPTPTATYGGGTAEAHVARKNTHGGNRDAVTGLNFIVEEALPLLPTPTVQDSSNTGGESQLGRNTEVALFPTPLALHADADGVAEYEALWDGLDDQSPFWVTDKGVDYWPAIQRWAQIVGRNSPSPTIPDGKGGRHRLNPRFTEWLMGQEDGWITALVIGLTRNEQLKACGNGVVTQQAELALSIAWPRVLEFAVAA